MRRNSASVVTDYVEIPREIPESRRELELSTDVMFINRLLFLVRISRRLMLTRNGSLFMKMMSVETSSYLHDSRNYLGISP